MVVSFPQATSKGEALALGVRAHAVYQRHTHLHLDTGPAEWAEKHRDLGDLARELLYSSFDRLGIHGNILSGASPAIIT